MPRASFGRVTGAHELIRISAVKGDIAPGFFQEFCGMQDVHVPPESAASALHRMGVPENGPFGYHWAFARRASVGVRPSNLTSRSEPPAGSKDSLLTCPTDSDEITQVLKAVAAGDGAASIPLRKSNSPRRTRSESGCTAKRVSAR